MSGIESGFRVRGPGKVEAREVVEGVDVYTGEGMGTD